MAELNTGDSGGGKKGSKKVRSKKSNAKVDLTAMVDLAFLLITFFMLTTSLSKPQSMDLGLPDKEDKPTDKPMKVDQRRTVTILMGKDNKIKWYHGLLDSPEPGGAPTDAVYGKNGIRKEILERVVSIPQITGDKKKGMIVIIKPTKKATYRNLVDILDEMAICDVPTYAIVNDITPEEQKLVDEMNK
ncbi:biopolymer transporter ExbD [Flavobacterium sp. IMCC34852]|uniref:Biopolymer transporter ExbD n=1 Tax=Flavobacterium rivulicola TaxID=2732161 RepID=A0A7Y3R629_9FLAO|nr:biopolymer transporter ExbD [Flavobacterium sp. IMCC34852]NNT70599.1 biopolymer transporter ExbD [Flavobacterium sp. IMCC34852]